MGHKSEKKEKSDDLKQELNIDFHKISKEELYKRLKTHPENVNHFVLMPKSPNIKLYTLSTEGSQSCTG